MKLRKILLGLALAGSLISHQAFALTPAEEVAQAKAAATARADAARAAILAEQARQYQIVYGKPLDRSTPVVTTPKTSTTPTATTTPTVITPIVSTPVASPSIDIAKFATAEYTSAGINASSIIDDYLRGINASSAWARGYTGAGSKILIIDSGINANHSEFLNSVTDTKDSL